MADYIDKQKVIRAYLIVMLCFVVLYYVWNKERIEVIIIYCICTYVWLVRAIEETFIMFKQKQFRFKKNSF